MTSIQISDGLGLKVVVKASMTQIPKIQKVISEWKQLNYLTDKRFSRNNDFLQFLRKRNVKCALVDMKPDVLINL